MDIEVLQSDEKYECGETEEESFVAGTISDAVIARSCSLDLKNRNLKEIPDRISDLPNLQKLYFSNNSLKAISPNILTALSQLRWLDLRDNSLTSIPPEIKRLEELQTLLIDNNKIKRLPLELGLLKKLSNLHHRNNPIEFPPTEVLRRGTKQILKFLLDHYLGLMNTETNEGSSSSEYNTKSTEMPENNNNINVLKTKQLVMDGINHDNTEFTDLINSLNSVNLKDRQPLHSVRGMHNSMDLNHSDLNCPRLERSYSADASFSGILQNENTNDDSDESKKVKTFDQVNGQSKLLSVLGSIINADDDSVQYHGQKINGSSCSRVSSKSKFYKRIQRDYLKSKHYTSKSDNSLLCKLPSQTSRHRAFLLEDPPQPTLEKIRLIYKREQKRKARKELMLKRASQIQRMKNASCISDWRDDYTLYQKTKLYEYLKKTYQEIKEEADQRIISGPLDVNKDHLKMIDSSELNSLRKQPIKKERPANLDSDTVLQLELASLARDACLTKRVHEHTKEILERFKLPVIPTHDAIRSELLTAKKSMDEAIRLHRRVQQRLETLRYFHGSNRRDLW
uniref:Putative leucine-rich repeat-containing protein n=1 Tax=Schistosoma mansoni TaxID=6183 RepID=A0A3Q0KPW1_SCHMA